MMNTSLSWQRLAGSVVLLLGIVATTGLPCSAYGSDRPAVDPIAAAGSPRTASWDELVPKDWDPSKLFRSRTPGSIREGSTAELALMREMREIWDNAPTRDDLDGARLKLPGYIVPLDMKPGGRMKEFLLVPYFGACIHTPPPPANQIVHVTLDAPAVLRGMDAVWVTGKLRTHRRDSTMGVSGYAMTAETIDPYQPETR